MTVLTAGFTRGARRLLAERPGGRLLRHGVRPGRLGADHWNDDAVFVEAAQQPYVGEWDELRYPSEHPYAGASIDLAFVIAGTLGETDWGDAPDPTYPTLASSNGAFHVFVPDVRLGALIDAETDGLPDAAALGDDNDNLADEDGVIFTSTLNAGAPATVDVVASVPGSLSAWIDFGGDGSWADPGDQIFFSEPLVAGVNPLAFAVPIDAAGGISFARFRFSTVGGLTYTGMAVDGEIEDYQVEIEGPVVDWGDAPDPGYPTLAVNDGAYHTIDSSIIMGLLIDAETDGQPDANALGDDTANLDDEDGVVFTSRLIPGETASVDVYVSAPGKLNAWVDFRFTGWGQPGEQIFTDRNLLPGRNSLTFDVPFNAQVRTTFARFRFSTAGGLPFDGPADDGEVEDYIVTIWPHDEYKWLQHPDLTETGVDVFSHPAAIMADDFLCEEPGLITNILVWGGWNGRVMPPPENVTFLVAFLEDIPAGTGGIPWSRPGEVLWSREIGHPDYIVDVWTDDSVAGWIYPEFEDYEFPADTTCLLHQFPIPEEEAFEQVGTPGEPVVYWLAVAAADNVGPPRHWGWRASLDHWNDAAMWGDAAAGWFWEMPVYYPNPHPYEGEQVDLAFALELTEGTGVPDGDEEMPQSFGLRQNVPNPFNPTTTIAYDVPAGGGHVAIEVFDASGRRIISLVDGDREEGRRSVTWHGVDDAGHALSSGIYFYRMTAGGVTETRKMVLLK